MFCINYFIYAINKFTPSSWTYLQTRTSAFPTRCPSSVVFQIKYFLSAKRKQLSVWWREVCSISGERREESLYSEDRILGRGEGEGDRDQI